MRIFRIIVGLTIILCGLILFAKMDGVNIIALMIGAPIGIFLMWFGWKVLISKDEIL